MILMLEKSFLLKWLKKAPSALAHIYSLILIILGWVIFYFEDMKQLWAYVGRLFVPSSGLISPESMVTLTAYLPLLLIACFACTPIAKNLYGKIEKKSWSWIPDTILCLLGLVVSVASLVSSGYNPFLYFKF